jgi:hypothetical protein
MVLSQEPIGVFKLPRRFVWRQTEERGREGDCRCNGSDTLAPPKRTRKPSPSFTLSVGGTYDPRPPKRRRVAEVAHFVGLDVPIEETAVSAGGASDALATRETQAAFDFSARASKHLP